MSWPSRTRTMSIPPISKRSPVAAAQNAGAIRGDLDVMELMALTTAVARAGDPAQAGRFLDMLLEGITPR